MYIINHMHRDTNRACLVGNTAWNTLLNPVRCVCWKFISQTIIKFINRLHQTDIAVLDQVRKIQSQTAITGFFSKFYNQTQIRLDHFAFGACGLGLATTNQFHNLFIFRCRLPGFICDVCNIFLDFQNFFGVFFRKIWPYRIFMPLQFFDPVAIYFVPGIFRQEIFAFNLVRHRQAQQFPFESHQQLVAFCQLFQNFRNTVVVQANLADMFE